MKPKKQKSKVCQLKIPNPAAGIYGVDANKSSIATVKSHSDIATKVKYTN